MSQQNTGSHSFLDELATEKMQQVTKGDMTCSFLNEALRQSGLQVFLIEDGVWRKIVAVRRGGSDYVNVCYEVLTHERKWKAFPWFHEFRMFLGEKQ